MVTYTKYFGSCIKSRWIISQMGDALEGSYAGHGSTGLGTIIRIAMSLPNSTRLTTSCGSKRVSSPGTGKAPCVVGGVFTIMGR